MKNWKGHYKSVNDDNSIKHGMAVAKANRAGNKKPVRLIDKSFDSVIKNQNSKLND